MNTNFFKPLVCLFSVVLAFTLVGPGCDKEVEDAGLPAERFEDGRYNLNLIAQVQVDATPYLEQHPDAVAIRVANGSESSVKLSYRDGEDDVLTTQFAVQDDGQGVKITITTASGETYEYSL